MARRYRLAGVKANRTYTVEEAAEVVGVTVQTVRAWIKSGLRAMTGRRPYLVLGLDLKEFLARSGAERKQPLEVGEFYCLRCKAARGPAWGLADYVPQSPTHGRLEAFCNVCEGPCTRIASKCSLADWRAICRIGGTIGADD